MDSVARAREEAELQQALNCGPQCASSVLATRYAKILRQERLLALARSALETLENSYGGSPVPENIKNHLAAVERSQAIRRQIDKEKKEPA